MLYELLPLIIQNRDSIDGSGLLRLLFSALEEEYEVQNEEIGKFLSILDSDSTPEDFLHLIAGYLGSTIPLVLGSDQKRRYVKNLPYLYKIKGTRLSWSYVLSVYGLNIDIVELWKSKLNEDGDYSYLKDSEHPFRAARVFFRYKGEDYYYPGLSDVEFSRYLLSFLESCRPIHVLVPPRVTRVNFVEPRILVWDGIDVRISYFPNDLKDEYSDDFGFSVGCASKCQTYCQDKCEIACVVGCQSLCESGKCEFPCEVYCEQTCQYFCMESCETSCEDDNCQRTCQTTCQATGLEAPCLTSCQGRCTACETDSQWCTSYCMVYCQLEDQYACNDSCQIQCQQEGQVFDCVEPPARILYFGLSSTEPQPDGSGVTEPSTGINIPISCESVCQSLSEIGACRTYQEHPESVLCYYECQTSCEADCETSCQYSDTSYCYTSVEGHYVPRSYERCPVDSRDLERVLGKDLGISDPMLKDAQFFVNKTQIVFSNQVEGWGTFPYFVVYSSKDGTRDLIAYGKIDPPLDTSRNYPVIRARNAVFRLLSEYRAGRMLGDVVIPQLVVGVSPMSISWRVSGGEVQEGSDKIVFYKGFLKNLCNGNIKWGRLAVLLVNDIYMFNSEHVYKNDVLPYEVSGIGYVSLGRLCNADIVTEEGSIILFADGVLWDSTSVVSEVGGAIFYSGDYLIGYVPMSKISGEIGSVLVDGSSGILKVYQ